MSPLEASDLHAAEARLAETRPANCRRPPEPKGVYKPLVVVGNLVYTSGHLPVDAGGRTGDRPASARSWTSQAGYRGGAAGRAGHPRLAAQGTRQPRPRRAAW